MKTIIRLFTIHVCGNVIASVEYLCVCVTLHKSMFKMSRSSVSQGNIKVNITCTEIGLFVFCDVCVTRMVNLRLKGILVTM